MSSPADTGNAEAGSLHEFQRAELDRLRELAARLRLDAEERIQKAREIIARAEELRSALQTVRAKRIPLP